MASRFNATSGKSDSTERLNNTAYVLYVQCIYKCFIYAVDTTNTQSIQHASYCYGCRNLRDKYLKPRTNQTKTIGMAQEERKMCICNSVFVIIQLINELYPYLIFD